MPVINVHLYAMKCTQGKNQQDIDSQELHHESWVLIDTRRI